MGFSSGLRPLCAPPTVMVYEIQIKASFRGLPQRIRTVALEKRFSLFSSDLIIIRRPPFPTGRLNDAARSARF